MFGQFFQYKLKPKIFFYLLPCKMCKTLHTYIVVYNAIMHAYIYWIKIHTPIKICWIITNCYSPKQKTKLNFVSSSSEINCFFSWAPLHIILTDACVSCLDAVVWEVVIMPNDWCVLESDRPIGGDSVKCVRWLCRPDVNQYTDR